MGRSPAQVLSRVSRDTYEPLATQLSNPEAYRPGFLSAIDNALNVRREDRPQSVAAWRGDADVRTGRRCDRGEPSPQHR